MVLRRDEFLRAPAGMRYWDVEGTPRELTLPAGTLGFTYCQAPVRYHLGTSRHTLRVILCDGVVVESDGSTLDATLSASIFARRGTVARIEVGVPASSLRL